MPRVKQEVCMLESTQDLIIRQDQVLNPVHRITRIMRAGGKLLLQLVSPEDTSARPGVRKHPTVLSEGVPPLEGVPPFDWSAFGGAFKLVFWMAAAIILSILMGQLS